MNNHGMKVESEKPRRGSSRRNATRTLWSLVFVGVVACLSVNSKVLWRTNQVYTKANEEMEMMRTVLAAVNDTHEILASISSRVMAVNSSISSAGIAQVSPTHENMTSQTTTMRRVTGFSESTSSNKQSTNNSQANGIQSASKTAQTIPKEHPEITCKVNTAACLYIKEENHRLIEWIAYHYYTLGMRRLIVINTMDAETTPRPILNRWKGRIKITLWNEKGRTDIWNVNMIGNQKSHRINQHRFMTHCFRTLKGEGWDLAYHFDPDEYLVLNQRLYMSGQPMYNANISASNLTILPMSEPCAVANFLHDIEPFHERLGAYTYGGPCREFPRLQFSNYQDETTQGNIPVIPGIDTYSMDTHQYHYAQGKAVGKGIVALKQVPSEAFKHFQTVHHPVARWEDNQCYYREVWKKETFSALVLYHFPATLENLLFRKKNACANDKINQNFTAKAIERFQYEKEREPNAKPRTHIQGWLPGFIKTMGESEVQRLLDRVGNFTAAAGTKILWDHNATRSTPSDPDLLQELF